MKINKIKSKGTWREVADSARTTIGLEEGTKEINSAWKKRMLMAEHSPIRQLIFKWKWIDIFYFASMHICRHWIGIIHWVKSQRTDRTGEDRNKKTQDALVNHEVEANAQALINISRVRLCKQASKETREAWKLAIEKVREIDPEVAESCVPNCIYRNGLCPEMKSCGWIKTKEFKEQLQKYISLFKNQNFYNFEDSITDEENNKKLNEITLESSEGDIKYLRKKFDENLKEIEKVFKR